MQSAGSESTWFYEWVAWVQDHSKQVFAGGVALLVLVFLGYTYQWKRGQTELAASTALLALTQRPGEDSPKPAAFVKVAEDYSSTEAAERAVLLAAGAYYEDGQYAEAQRAFEGFARTHAGSLLEPIAALGVAASLDAQEKPAEAIAAYRSVLSDYPEDPVADRARLDLATLYESQEQPAEALRLYEVLTAKTTFTQAAMQATSRRDQLLLKHPELAPKPTNETSTVISPSPVTDSATAPGVLVNPLPAPTNEAPATVVEEAAESAPAEVAPEGDATQPPGPGQ